MKAKIIQQVSYEKFTCNLRGDLQNETTYQTVDGLEWIEIKLKKGRVGYVAEKYCSCSLDKELTVAKVKGEWKIISFFTPMGC